MKKVLLAASIASALSLFNVAHAAGDAGGTITFDGEITDATCEVALNGSTSGTGTVRLPTISKSALSAAAGTEVANGRQNFELTLTNCASPKSGKSRVQALFQTDAANVDPQTGNLFNKGVTATDANDVQLQLLYGSDDAVIDLNAPVLAVGDSHFVSFGDTTDAAVAGGTATLPFKVQYITKNNGKYNNSTVGTAALKSGKVTGQVTYILQYD